MSDVTKRIGELRLMPVVAIDSADDALPLADALIEGGLPCAEITLRTDAGIEAIRQMSHREDFLVGAGTVHSCSQAKQVVDAGGHFIVAPGFNPKTVQWCIDNGVPIYPGISSPTDLEMALDFGLEVVKFFPAEALGGIKMLRALSAPYGGIRFMPTGGINESNLRQYLELPQVIACGGSWMVKSDFVNNRQFQAVVDRTAEAVLLANQGNEMTKTS